MESQEFKIGDTVYSLNLKYSDGTCLRYEPTDEKKFNECIVLNDTPVLIKDIQNGFALIEKSNGDSGWIRLRNLTKNKRVTGFDKRVIKTEIVTPDKEYIRGIKLYGIGIKADCGSSKLGKGDFHLISPIWINDFMQFIFENRNIFKIYIKNAFTLSENPNDSY